MRRHLLALVIAILGLALLALFLRFRYLPMVDLPQHCAQVSGWVHGDDPSFRLGEQQLNLGTPYLVAYAVARLLVPFVGILAALKLVVWIAVIGNALALWRLAHVLGHDAWLGLLGLPTAIGYSFYFGFISFILATPLVILCWSEAIQHARQPGWPRGVRLGALLGLVFATHGLAFALAFALAGVTIWFDRPLARRWAPLTAPAALALTWIPGFWHGGPGSGGEQWALGWYRFRDLVGMLAGPGSVDRAATICGVSILLITGLALGKPTPAPARLLPLAIVLAGYFLFPFQLRAVGFLYERFAAFVVPALLCAFAPGPTPYRLLPTHLARLVVTTLCVGWVCVLGVRLRTFQREATGMDELISRLPRGLRIRPLVFDREGQAFPGVAAFVHFSSYYHAEKGGYSGYSFASNPTSVIRYRPGFHFGMRPGKEWQPETFDARTETLDYDYFIVRSTTLARPSLFASAPCGVVLDLRAGSFWGYRRSPTCGSARASAAPDVP